MCQGCPMDLFEALRRRRSVRRFADIPVPGELVDKILLAAFLSPSSYNRRPWHFIVVDDRKTLKPLSRAKPGAIGLENAAVAIVVAVDSSVDDVWIEDGAIAAEHMQLAAVALGLSSFWVQIRNRKHSSGKDAEEFVRDTLGIPDEYRVVCIIGIGYPAERKAPRGDEVLEWRKVSHNMFGKAYKGCDLCGRR